MVYSFSTIRNNNNSCVCLTLSCFALIIYLYIICSQLIHIKKHNGEYKIHIYIE